jgi:threonine dehydratase
VSGSLSPDAVAAAHRRVAPYVRRTPVLTSTLLDAWLGHRLFFKAEGLQKIGAFKIRGATNALLSLKEQGRLPKEVVAFSSGNHAQGVALAARTLGVKATVHIPEGSSPTKARAAASYGADVVFAKTRQEAEERTEAARRLGAHLLHPYDDDAVIAGQGTACLEALEDCPEPDAIFAPCGGGGLLSGSVLAKELASPSSKIYAGEPLAGNDAARSYRSGGIVRLDKAPDTIADGARTLAVGKRTFPHLRRLDGFFEIDEPDVIYWTQWLNHLLKVAVEPTSALAMAAACAWLKTQDAPKRVLVLLSGGNIAPEAYLRIWERDRLGEVPSLG